MEAHRKKMQKLKKLKFDLSPYYSLYPELEFLNDKLKQQELFKSGLEVIEYLMTVNQICLTLADLNQRLKWEDVTTQASYQEFVKHFSEKNIAEICLAIKEDLWILQDHYKSFKASVGRLIEEGMDAIGIEPESLESDDQSENDWAVYNNQFCEEPHFRSV